MDLDHGLNRVLPQTRLLKTPRSALPIEVTNGV